MLKYLLMLSTLAAFSGWSEEVKAEEKIKNAPPESRRSPSRFHFEVSGGYAMLLHGETRDIAKRELGETPTGWALDAKALLRIWGGNRFAGCILLDLGHNSVSAEKSYPAGTVELKHEETYFGAGYRQYFPSLGPIRPYAEAHTTLQLSSQTTLSAQGKGQKGTTDESILFPNVNSTVALGGRYSLTSALSFTASLDVYVLGRSNTFTMGVGYDL